MRIVARVNLSVPWHGAGAETYLHSLLRELARRGHDVEVWARGAPRDAVVDDVPIYRALHRAIRPGVVDVVITHLDDTHDAQALARSIDAPLVGIMHNHRQATIYGHAHDHVTRLLVFNSQWTREATRPLWEGAAVVFHPPVDPSDYAVDDLVKRETTVARQVTLVNLQAAKGADVFYELARRLPGVPFVGVVGGYGQQVIRTAEANVRILDHVPPDAMRDRVYTRTKVLLMPSDYESFGRCAIEAAWAGVPTIAHPTGGLVEALGFDGAGVFAHRDLVDEWERVVRCLLLDERHAERYAWHSAAARRRAEHMRPDYDEVVAAIEAVAIGRT